MSSVDRKEFLSLVSLFLGRVRNYFCTWHTSLKLVTWQTVGRFSCSLHYPPTFQGTFVRKWWEPAEPGLSFPVAQRGAFKKRAEQGTPRAEIGVCEQCSREASVSVSSMLVSVLLLVPSSWKKESHFRSVANKRRGVLALALSVLNSASPTPPPCGEV